MMVVVEHWLMLNQEKLRLNKILKNYLCFWKIFDDLRSISKRDFSAAGIV